MVNLLALISLMSTPAYTQVAEISGCKVVRPEIAATVYCDVVNRSEAYCRRDRAWRDAKCVLVACAHPEGGGRVQSPGCAYHVRQSWIRHQPKASPAQLCIMHVEVDSVAPTLLGGDTVLVDITRQLPNPPGIFVLDDGMGLVAKRLEHIPISDPPAVRVISDNKLYPEY